MDNQFVYVCTSVFYRTNEQTSSYECVCDTYPVRHIFTTQRRAEQWLNSTAKFLIHEGGTGWSFHYTLLGRDNSNAVAVFENNHLRYHLVYVREEVIS